MTEVRFGAQLRSEAAETIRALGGPVGVWVSLDRVPTAEALRFAGLVEDLGYGALWIPESTGREPFALMGALARSTRRLTLGLGIASIHARDAVAAHAGARTLADLTAGRFVMGLGVSHASSAAARGHPYERPLATMAAYLDAWDAAPWTGPAVVDPPLVLAALGPRMLGLAATRTAGAFAFLVTAGQVAEARRTLDAAWGAAGDAATSTAGGAAPGGDGIGGDTVGVSTPDLGRPVLIASQAAILGSGPAVQAAARASIARYLAQPNYRNNLIRAGFDPAAIDAAADPVVEALVATGDETALRTRVDALLAAGADHVTVIPLSTEGLHADAATARALAPG